MLGGGLTSGGVTSRTIWAYFASTMLRGLPVYGLPFTNMTSFWPLVRTVAPIWLLLRGFPQMSKISPSVNCRAAEALGASIWMMPSVA